MSEDPGPDPTSTPPVKGSQNPGPQDVDGDVDAPLEGSQDPGPDQDDTPPAKGSNNPGPSL